jgi:serine/threonine protein phosphatase PrpC
MIPPAPIIVARHGSRAQLWLAMTLTPVPPGRKPRDDEIDMYGLTHVGKVRKDNQDQFLMALIHKRLNVVLTSLTSEQRDALSGEERVGGLAMVADGVGGGEGGAEASATALEAVTEYVKQSAACFYRGDHAEAQFIDELQAAATRAHQAILHRRSAAGVRGTMATTLTLWFGVWPASYLLQVGDSRYYLLRDGQLRQLSRDQTMAQDLVDEGVLSRTAAFRTQFANVLSSALGAENTVPVVTRVSQRWDQVGLLCSDGLTKHVSDERIEHRLRTMTSAKQVCEQLLQDALDGGGSDNITVVVGRFVPKGPI